MYNKVTGVKPVTSQIKGSPQSILATVYKISMKTDFRNYYIYGLELIIADLP